MIFQHSPLAIAARREAGIDNLHELVGKRVMLEPHAAELLAMLRREGISGNQLQLLPHGFGTADLLNGQADAMSIYTTETQLAQHPARTAAFVTASLRGWSYAMAMSTRWWTLSSRATASVTTARTCCSRHGKCAD